MIRPKKGSLSLCILQFGLNDFVPLSIQMFGTGRLFHAVWDRLKSLTGYLRKDGGLRIVGALGTKALLTTCKPWTAHQSAGCPWSLIFFTGNRGVRTREEGHGTKAPVANEELNVSNSLWFEKILCLTGVKEDVGVITGSQSLIRPMSYLEVAHTSSGVWCEWSWAHQSRWIWQKHDCAPQKVCLCSMKLRPTTECEGCSLVANQEHANIAWRICPLLPNSVERGSHWHFCSASIRQTWKQKNLRQNKFSRQKSIQSLVIHWNKQYNVAHQEKSELGCTGLCASSTVIHFWKMSSGSASTDKHN